MTLATMQWHEAVTLRNYRDFRRTALARLARRHVRGPRVLDMRCLNGAFALDLAASGMDVTALDAFPGAVEQTNDAAHRRGLPPLARLWNLTGLAEQVKGRQFDTVVCLDVLNHVADDAQTMREIAQVLAPGGRLVLAAPALPGLLGRRDRSLGHLRRYTRSGLRSLLETHGLRVEMMRFWNFAALPLYALIERGFGARTPDGLRYGNWGVLGAWPNRLLTWWYTDVENRVQFPCGLTWVVVSRNKEY